MLLFCSWFFLLWKRPLIYCFLADSSVSYGKQKQNNNNNNNKKKKKKHDCNITILIVRLCSGKTLTMLSMWFGLLEKAWLKFCFLAGCQMWTHITVSSFEPSHDKTNKVTVRPVKTQFSLGIRPVWLESSLSQISLGIRPVWSEFLLSAWGKLGSLATQAHSEDSDQTGRIWVLAGRTVTLLVLSLGGSFVT